MQPLIIDCDPGIDDVLALIMAFKSPEVDVRAVTLTHGNTTLQNVKRNAVTLMDVMAAQHIEDEKNGLQSRKQSPVLAVGRATPLNSDQVFATEFHGHDGLGNIYEQGLHSAPTDWENQLLHDAEREGARNRPFQSTPRDAADEILHQLRIADPLSVSILAVGPLTNLALAIQRDPLTFSRAKDIIILGGSLTAGNITPYGEFNFVADPIAADLVLAASKGFDRTEQGERNRVDLLSQGKIAPIHIVVLPIDSAECGAIHVSHYKKHILPLRKTSPLFTFINSFLVHAFEVMEKLFHFDYMATYDAFALILLLDMLNGTLEKHWSWKWHDMRVETTGKYTMGMSCVDTRNWESPEGSWNDQANVIQVITKASGDNFIQSFMKRIFDVHLIADLEKIMVKKVIDSRIHTLVKNGVQNKHRSFFVIVGDKGKDQVVNLHWLLSQAQVTARPSVLWCYKKELGFTTHRKKREAKIKKDIKRGIREANTEDPFELFVAVTDIRYTYYKETQKILGNTYGMCILQDFEAVTPNTLARTIETVEGGGCVVLLLKSMNSLKQLYTMTMDVHSRYRTEAHDDVTARFNERFILSLGNCENCLVVDDELNVLPISMGKSVKPAPLKTPEEMITPEQIELKELKESLADTEPIGSLVKPAKTLDQAKALLTFIEAISEKSLKSTVTLTASRGRGKSAALGIAIAAAVAYGYSNIFVTSPSPENLKTLFEFIFKGFDALNYEEHLDYDIVQSTNPAFNKAIVRVNIFRQHRQTIQYIQPQDAHVLGQAELVVIDEAAAIPLPLVKKLLGPYLVFMASTINGYEGTGRSLSLKLIQQLREQSRGFVGRAEGPLKDAGGEDIVVGRDLKSKKDTATSDVNGAAVGGRSLREIKLEEPIRYALNDPVEKWLNKLLCLDATIVSKNIQGCPHPSECELFYVNRDTLFSYHPVSETFLQRMMALYVASHYKNSPNDLQLMSDAPAHHLFVLLPPIREGDASLPDPLVVVQVCLEGEISKQSVMNSLSRGQRAGGDLIPWLISQQFQDDDFAALSGARVVRIATHPDYAKMGYGARALDQLKSFYQGEITSLDENAMDEDSEQVHRVDDDELEEANLLTDDVRIRDPRKMPPLLMRLSEKKPVRLHYLGVSYGLTQQLHRFWKKSGFVPLYLRQTANELTGEHTCVMLNTLNSQDVGQDDWLDAFARDFKKRFINLLSYQFNVFPSVTALSILEAASAGTDKSKNNQQGLNKVLLNIYFNAYDLKRLESYANNMLDYHVIIDMLPTISELLFKGQMADHVKLSGVQNSILLALGLQRKSVDDLEKELNLPSSQILALFIKAVRKISTYFKQIESRAIEEASAIPAKRIHDDEDEEEEARANGKRNIEDVDAWRAVKEDLDEDLEEAGQQAIAGLKDKQRDIINSLDLKKYAIGGTDQDWQAAEDQIKASQKDSKLRSVVSVKNENSSKKTPRRKTETAAEIAANEAKHKSGKTKMSKKTRRG